MSTRRIQLFTACVVLALVLRLFGPAALGQESFIFRDAAHYYGPLFAWNVSEWRSGRAPLWNPLENLGSPALGDNTSSVFYPGQLLLFAPIDFLWAYNLYVVAHVGLAAWGAWRLARRFGCGPAAAGQCSLVYAFSGAVMFQYCNVVFLVGAAWLPLALEAIDRLLHCGNFRGSLRLACWLAICLAMMTLGGDPQMAYHVGLAAAAYAVILSRDRSGAGDNPASAAHMPAPGDLESPESPGPVEKSLAPPGPLARSPVGQSQRGSPAPIGLFRRGAWLAFSFALFAALAAVQILPAYELASQSPRACDDGPRNVWELASWTIAPPAATIDGEPVPRPERSLMLDARAGESHLQHVYQFSVGPWRWLELAWPNIGGRQFPIHRRWFSELEGEKRIWAPSLYAGALALPLALAGWRRGRGPAWRWMKWLGAAAALASLGEYGIGWAAGGALQFVTGRTLVAGPEVGGVYWLMNMLLPGYVAFRYPAKLWTIAALALALLSARGCEAALAGEDRTSVGRSMKWLALAGALGLGAAGLARAWLLDRFTGARADLLFGPLDASGAWADLALAFAQGAIVSLAGWMVLRFYTSRGAWAPIALLALTGLDLGVAHRWLVPCAPLSAWERPPAFRLYVNIRNERSRIYRDVGWLPDEWRKTGSPDRLQKMLAWDRDTISPKYHLPLDVGSVESTGMMTDDYAAFWDVARLHGPERPDGASMPHRMALDLVDAKYFLLPSGVHYDATSQGTAARKVVDAVPWWSDHYPPRFWVAYDVEQLPPLDDRRPAAIRRRTERVFFPGGEPRDFWRQVVVESAAPVAVRLGMREANDGMASCDLTSFSSNRATLWATLASPGLLVLADAYYPGWRAIVTHDGVAREAEILRTDRVLRGVMLPAGKSEIEFVYDPRSYRVGLALSGLACLGLAAAGGAALAITLGRRIRGRFV